MLFIICGIACMIAYQDYVRPTIRLLCGLRWTCPVCWSLVLYCPWWEHCVMLYGRVLEQACVCRFWPVWHQKCCQEWVVLQLRAANRSCEGLPNLLICAFRIAEAASRPYERVCIMVSTKFLIFRVGSAVVIHVLIQWRSKKICCRRECVHDCLQKRCRCARFLAIVIYFPSLCLSWYLCSSIAIA